MTEFLALMATGVSFGAAFALLALSINIIYSSSNILNFAQGEFMMLGGMLGWALYSSDRLPYLVAFVAIIAILAVVGAAEYYLVAAPLLRRRVSLISIIIATLGFSIVLRIGTALTMGRVERFAKPPLGQDSFQVAGIPVIPQSLVIVAITAVALALVWWLYSRTTLGLALRATAFQADGARLVGVNTSRVMAATFAAGAAMAGIAGFVVSPLSFASPWIGLDFAIQGFAAAIVGGLGSWPGAVVGGLLMGVLRSLMLQYVSPEWGNLFTFGVVLLMLYVRPTGLFGERQVAAGSH
jgi:branched-chain amino acid transport system permease protein